MIEAHTHRGKQGTVLHLWVQPRSSREGPLGEYGDPVTAVKWGVRSAPVDGQANAELLKSLSRILSVSKSALLLLRGEQSRRKTVFVEGLTPHEVNARIDSN